VCQKNGIFNGSPKGVNVDLCDGKCVIKEKYVRKSFYNQSE